MSTYASVTRWLRSASLIGAKTIAFTRAAVTVRSVRTPIGSDLRWDAVECSTHREDRDPLVPRIGPRPAVQGGELRRTLVVHPDQPPRLVEHRTAGTALRRRRLV